LLIEALNGVDTQAHISSERQFSVFSSFVVQIN
jgi:hypothetical protein